ncbi:MAG TPA: ferrous iron transport protein B [Firmicutes bacterium]|nr:ferrous iron transport protein B [Bacillota bacterium]
MGLTHKSTGFNSLAEIFAIKKKSPQDTVVALAGNPNTGKSTVFNSLTGLKQHTGNWPGKTVTNAQGEYSYQGNNYLVVDLPGTYSLLANSVEEEIARDFICFGKPDVTVVVLDATCLERNLNLALQILEITGNVVICVNLIDEAERKKIKLDLAQIACRLGVPVVGTNAREGRGLPELKAAIAQRAKKLVAGAPVTIKYPRPVEDTLSLLVPSLEKKLKGKINTRWAALRLLDNNENMIRSLNNFLGFDLLKDPEMKQAFSAAEKLNSLSGSSLREPIVESIFKEAENIISGAVVYENPQYNDWDRKIDNILTSKTWGIPIMLAVLGLIFWLTIQGVNAPSAMLASGFEYLEQALTNIFTALNAPAWLHGIVVLGVFKTLGWVVSVMLPPMAIFFPLFTLLEDLGYLPRIAFNLDNFFKRSSAHGKQALTMCMGFGCNAAGVISCRIIDSSRERLIAIITNNFVPCNGRFPILIALASTFIASRSPGPLKNAAAALGILMAVVLGIILTLLLAKILSLTVLKGLPSSFALELPPYRKPQIGRIIVRSIFDRTLFVLGRAILVAAPAGMLIWLAANINFAGNSLLNHSAGFLDPFAALLGLDGYILMAFILGLPANEIVIPILVMSYMSGGTMLELENLEMLRQLFLANGWTWVTALCTMLFTLNHWPCGTTLLTIRKETQSVKWTFISFLVPVLTGIILCFLVNQSFRLLGLV